MILQLSYHLYAFTMLSRNSHVQYLHLDFIVAVIILYWKSSIIRCIRKLLVPRNPHDIEFLEAVIFFNYGNPANALENLNKNEKVRILQRYCMFLRHTACNMLNKDRARNRAMISDP